jgi:hypothetical protein
MLKKPFCHPEPSPEFISGSSISGSLHVDFYMLNQACPEEMLK